MWRRTCLIPLSQPLSLASLSLPAGLSCLSMWNFKGSSHLANDTCRSCLLTTKGKRLELSVLASSQTQFCQIKQRWRWVRNVLPVIVWVMTSSKSHKTSPSHSIIRPFCPVLTSANKHEQTSARSIGKKEKKKSQLRLNRNVRVPRGVRRRCRVLPVTMETM